MECVHFLPLGLTKTAVTTLWVHIFVVVYCCTDPSPPGGGGGGGWMLISMLESVHCICRDSMDTQYKV